MPRTEGPDVPRIGLRQGFLGRSVASEPTPLRWRRPPAGPSSFVRPEARFLALGGLACLSLLGLALGAGRRLSAGLVVCLVAASAPVSVGLSGGIAGAALLGALVRNPADVAPP